MIKNVFLLSEVRSGSTYAAELLSYNFHKRDGDELWDLAREHFQSIDATASVAQLQAAIDQLWVTPRGVRACMIKCGQLGAINKIIARDPGLTRLFYGEDSYWIVLRRRDVVAQAVSLACARCSGEFHHYGAAPPCTPCRRGGPDVATALNMILASQVFITECQRRFTHGAAFDYEEILADPAGFLDDCDRFLFAGEGGFGATPLEQPRLEPVHSTEKVALRHGFTQWLLENYHG